jgi:hypothetical protein
VSKPAPQIVNNNSIKLRDPKQAAFHNQPSRFAAWRLFCFTHVTLPLFEIARVLVRFDHVDRLIANANHSIK